MSRLEWIMIIVGPILTAIALLVIGWDLEKHRSYIRSRDVRWESVQMRIEENQVKILDHIRREEERWGK